MRPILLVLIILSNSLAPMRAQSISSRIDLEGGLDKERRAAFDDWQNALASFNSTFFPPGNLSVPEQAPYCKSASRFNGALKQLRAAHQKAYDKEKEYFTRWLKDLDDDIESRQVSIARVEKNNKNIQNTLRLKEQEVKAMAAPDADMEALIKDDPDRGKIVQEARRRAQAISQASYESLGKATFNSAAAIANIDQKVSYLKSLKKEVALSLDALNADLFYQTSYFDLRDSEVDLRCNSNIRPGELLLGSPKKK
jgi:hypothetical protein